jgi:hypothetical protein
MKKIQEFISYEENLKKLLDNDENLFKSIKAVFAEFFKLEKNVNKYTLCLIFKTIDKAVSFLGKYGKSSEKSRKLRA